jgi:hypothetical protein
MMTEGQHSIIPGRDPGSRIKDWTPAFAGEREVRP